MELPSSVRKELALAAEEEALEQVEQEAIVDPQTAPALNVTSEVAALQDLGQHWLNFQ